MQHFILLSIGLAVIIDLLLLATLLRQRNERFVRIFQHLILGALFWNACTFLFILTEYMALAPLAYISALYFFVARHHFVMNYTHTEAPLEIRILNGIAIVLSLLAFVPDALFVNPHVSPEGYIFVGNGWFTIYFALYLIYMTIRPLQILFRHTLATKSHGLRILTLGMSVYAVITISTNFILPIFFDIPFLNTIGPAFSSLFSLIIFYSITRYQFLHIKLIIQRGIIFSVLYGFTIALYSVFASTLVGITRGTFHASELIIALTILTAALLVPPLERLLRRLTDRILLQQSYWYDDVTRALAALFAQHVTTRAILQHTLAYMKTTLRLKHMRYHKGEAIPDDLLAKNTAFPVHAATGCIGYILVGQKRSNDPLTKTDKKILEFYVIILGVALEKARLFEHLGDEVAARTREIAAIHDGARNNLAMLAHDLKTPLTALLGMHELMSASPEISRERFDTLALPLRTITRTINEIVRFETHTPSPHAMLNLSHLVFDLAEQMNILCDMEKIGFTSNIEQNIMMFGDARNLELMINNVLSNAIRYSSADAPSITLTLTSNAQEILLVITDNGIGIPKQALAHIFTPGFRAHNALDRDGSGTGLATTRKIADAHRATIHIESTEHVGTTVTIQFQTPAEHSV